MSESKNVAVDILRAEAARREVLIAELQREAAELNTAADVIDRVVTVVTDPVTLAARRTDLEAAEFDAGREDDRSWDEGRGEPDDETEYLTSSPVNADRLYSSLREVPKPQPPRDRAFGPRVQHLSPADMPRPS